MTYTAPQLGANTATLSDLLDNTEAATLVQCSPNYMRLSRHTGLLFGVPAPCTSNEPGTIEPSIKSAVAKI